jgi:MFS family permease
MAFPLRGTLRSVLILCVVFVVGGVLMGFEMLGSRFLYPYFGGGIGTWAALISTVLYALAIGYFVGGAVVDRYPSLTVIAACIGVAALYLLAIPAGVDKVMQAILDSYGYGMWAVLLAAGILLALPVGLLGMLSPAAVRLLIGEAGSAGQVAGAVYGVSAVGNVAGILLTTFALIPTIGSRAITYCYAATLALCGVALFLGCRVEGVAEVALEDRLPPGSKSRAGQARGEC